jgi:hypothetical protein
MALTGLTAVENGYSFTQSRRQGASEVSFGQGLGFAVIGTALGLLTGVAAASGPWGANSSVMANDSASVTLTAPASSAPAMSATMSTSTVQQAAPAPVVQSQLSQHATEAAAPVLVRASLETTVTHHTAVQPGHHTVSNLFVKSAIRPNSELSASTSTPEAPVAAAMAVSSVPASTENVSKPAAMVIEGDLTVADFDASTGTVETREGRSFSINQAGSDGNTLAWQDYAGNVHYKCTQGGSCTLAGSHVSASGARLI